MQEEMKGTYRIDGQVVRDLHEGVADALKSDTLGGALDAIAQQARLMVGAHQSAISYIPDGDFTRACHATSFSDKYEKYRTYDVMPTGAGIWGKIFETREAMRLTEKELYQHPRFRHFSDLKDERGLEHPPMPGWLAVPIRRPNGQPIGVLQLSDRFEGDFTDEDQNLLEHLANLISATFEAEYMKAELERSNKELDDFAYVASHDLQAPLRNIDNLAKWIIQDVGDSLPEKSARHLETLCNRIHRMEVLLDELLNYSRAGRVFDKSEDIDLMAVLNNVITLATSPRGFTIELPQQVPSLRTPKAPLERVLHNLIGNAIKHHDRDTGRITITVKEIPRFIEFSVSDDGPGIAQDAHKQVFKMFHTVKPRDEVEGSGMGLAIVKKLVDAHGGAIWLKSREQEGATFTFTWPKAFRR